MEVITRFAPSPTGLLHIGGARTALFNWLYSRHCNGTFLLRIEDTDKARSTTAAINAILDGMRWLGLEWDGDVIYQSQRAARHLEIARELVSLGKAYYCYSTPEEIAEFREKNPHQKFQSPWREKKALPASHNSPVIRLKANHEGATVIEDRVQGNITVNNNQLDDMILVRSDNTPTYMLAVVVDDYDMKVNYVIRGDDHLTNAFRQNQIYDAMGWAKPVYAHIPLIHGSDGAKLSKRHGALGVEAYKEMGYLPESLRNYLLRLGWSYGDEEIIPTSRAIELFDIKDIGKSPARFDITKLNHINAHYLKNRDDHELLDLVMPMLGIMEDDIVKARILAGMPQIKERANTLLELTEVAMLYKSKRENLDEKSIDILNKGGLDLLNKIKPVLKSLENWNLDHLRIICKVFAEENGFKLALVMQSLRAGVLGTFASPGILEVMEVLGKEEVLTRMKEY